MPTIARTITGDTPASVTLLSLTRVDTGAPVAFPAGGAFSPAGSAWSISFAAPAPNLVYAYSYSIAFGDGTTIIQNANYPSAIVVPPAVATATGFAYCLDSARKPVVGAQYAVRMNTSNTGANCWDTSTEQVSSAADSAGYATVTLVIGASYLARTKQGPWGELFTVTAGPTFAIPETDGPFTA